MIFVLETSVPVLTSRSRRYLQQFTYCVVKIHQVIKIAQKPIPIPKMRVEPLVRGSTTSVRKAQMPFPHQMGPVAQFFRKFLVSQACHWAGSGSDLLRSEYLADPS
jgi:hypothetical protein